MRVLYRFHRRTRDLSQRPDPKRTSIAVLCMPDAPSRQFEDTPHDDMSTIRQLTDLHSHAERGGS